MYIVVQVVTEAELFFLKKKSFKFCISILKGSQSQEMKPIKTTQSYVMTNDIYGEQEALHSAISQVNKEQMEKANPWSKKSKGHPVT